MKYKMIYCQGKFNLYSDDLQLLEEAVEKLHSFRAGTYA